MTLTDDLLFLQNRKEASYRAYMAITDLLFVLEGENEDMDENLRQLAAIFQDMYTTVERQECELKMAIDQILEEDE